MGLESKMFGLDKSKPTALKPSRIAVVITVNAKPIRNCMKILRCCPKIRSAITEDKTNIQANEQTKAATEMLPPSHKASDGTEAPKEEATVVSTVVVKNW